ncbi:glycosyltransferase family 4 protein [Cohnella soli]|uniref:Glycosyltransferase family 4 protein n=1 Tax=Cohnella soli TaxID=425005 RepID=A0ABW0HXW8_9BACL
MNIYVNARFLMQHVTGVQRYAIELIKRWDALLGEESEDRGNVNVTLLVPPGAARELSLEHIRTRVVGSFGGHAWEQTVLPFYAKDGLLVNLCNTGPMFARKQIVTIHDAAVYDQPEAYSFLFRSAYKLIQRAIGRSALRVLTVSQFSKSRIMSRGGIPEKKIRVFGHGREHMLELVPEEGFLEKHRLIKGGYLLAVSSLNPSKNFASIARAIELLEDVHYPIVIAGGMNGRVFSKAEMPHSDKVKLVGYVSDEQLKALYDGAGCFVFPSLYEGFGLPPLEAMACGTPVIASGLASLPEVCGEATLYCDPLDPRDIATKINSVMNDASLRKALSARGLRRAERFTWEECARATWKAVKEVYPT